jgi:hypothetical protein
MTPEDLVAFMFRKRGPIPKGLSRDQLRQLLRVRRDYRGMLCELKRAHQKLKCPPNG